MSKSLIVLAAKARIDASEMSLEQLKKAAHQQYEDFSPYVDQHIMNLLNALK